MGERKRYRGKGNGPQERQPEVVGSGQQQLSREDREKKKLNKQKKHEDYMATKLKLAGQENTAVVKTDTPETSRASGLLNKNDYYIARLRENLITNKNIHPFTAVFLLQMNSKIRDLLNTQNALLCHALGYQSGYEPPWGCEAPRESHEAVIEEMMALIAEHEKMVPLAEKVQPHAKEIKQLATAGHKRAKETAATAHELPAGTGEPIAVAAT